MTVTYCLLCTFNFNAELSQICDVSYDTGDFTEHKLFLPLGKTHLSKAVHKITIAQGKVTRNRLKQSGRNL